MLGSDLGGRQWQTYSSPTQKTLYQIVNTVNGPVAVGASGTIVTRRDGDWRVLVDDGPATRDNALRGIDVTDDGTRVWFLGSSGSLGCYDVETDRKYDYSFPKEMTSTWEGIAVSGDAGSEKALASNGSGEVLPFAIDGFDIKWGYASKPGSGAKITALAASSDGVGYAVNTSGSAYRTTESDGWKDIGIVNAQVNFYDIWAGENGRVYVAAGGGRVYRYDDSYHSWTPLRVGKGALRAFGVEDETMVAAGASGHIYQRTPADDVPRWDRLHSPTEKTIYDIALGETDYAVASGGHILVREGSKKQQNERSPDGDTYDGRGESYDADDNAPQESTADAKDA
ncbi:PQQ-like beta-propeller repeat protein [Halocalculus aciditolerans]|uniref:Uncharacterized protein n=1 Tax=Halocalculus aciditolerans TaxID=1383812 RepID=A0A830FP55_9EURY|nr:PQQ-like beta-propeller repeat protein [Halocalculus aciditolerans]GGL66627.1 hypothetical protein GCM10009039_25730 [Halocalculus aciditolerans]